MNTIQEERSDGMMTTGKHHVGRWPDYAGTMIVCFSGVEDGIPAGKLWSFYFERPYPFHGLDGMLFAMETVMDDAGKPSAWCERRSLCATPKRRGVKRQPYVPPPQSQIPFYSASALSGRRGRLCTAVVRVHQRQNASIQGELQIPGREKVGFRSALELLYLLREFLELATAKGGCG